MFFRQKYGKKRKVDSFDLIVTHNTSPTLLEKKDYITSQFSQIPFAFIEYLAPFDTHKFMQTNTTYKQLYRDDTLIWRKLYHTHFGETYTTTHFKIQYFMENLYQTTRQPIVLPSPSLTYLNNIITKAKEYPGEGWASYYRSVTASVNVDRSSYAKIAFTSGDFRGAEYMVGFYMEECVARRNVNLYVLQEFQDEMLTQNKDGRFDYAIALTYSIMFQLENKLWLNFNAALFFYKKSIKPFGKNVAEFVKQTASFLEMLDLTRLHLPTLMQRLQQLKPQNNLTVLYEVFDFDFCSNILLKYFKELADDNNGLSAFFYAEKLRNKLISDLITHSGSETDYLFDANITQRIDTAKKYYVKAYENGEYRSIIKLRSLLTLKPELKLLNDDQYQAMLETGIRHQDPECLITQAWKVHHHQWHKQVYNIWLLQAAAATCEPHAQGFFNALVNQEDNPDKNIYIHCALTFLYGLVEKNKAKSFEKFQFCLQIDPFIFAKYQNFGRQYGLLNKEHTDLIKQMAAQQNENKIEHNTKRIKMTRN